MRVTETMMNKARDYNQGRITHACVVVHFVASGPSRIITGYNETMNELDGEC